MEQREVFVLVDRDEDDGTVRRSTCVLLTVARRLGQPVAVVCGFPPPSETAIRTLARYGATRVFVSQDPVVLGLHVLADDRVPAAVLISSGYAGQEIAGRLAVRLDSGVITDAVDVRLGPDGPIATQSCLAHSYLVESRVVRGIPVITVRSEAAVPTPAPDPAEPEVEWFGASPTFDREPLLLSRTRNVEDRGTSLENADVVVAGGRGLGSAESFQILARLAEALGGAVGGSHTATELGWCPRDRRIGLTGKTVHPRLYLASGVSGSVRHRAGMQGAKTVVAIGDDPAAPIFRIADLGVVGDVHEVLPALLAEITRRKTQQQL